ACTRTATRASGSNRVTAAGCSTTWPSPTARPHAPASWRSDRRRQTQTTRSRGSSRASAWPQPGRPTSSDRSAHDVVRPHHLVLFVLQDVAVEHIPELLPTRESRAVREIELHQEPGYLARH